MKATLLVGGPEPADSGRINIIRYCFLSSVHFMASHIELSVHAGTTQGTVKSNFGESERVAIKSLLVPLYGRFLKKCYSKFLLLPSS